MADPPPALEQRVSLQDMLAGAAVPFLSALCRPGAPARSDEDAGSSSQPIVSGQGVRAVIALAQTGVLGSPSEAAAVLKEIWFSICPAGSIPSAGARINASNSLEELRKAAEEAGVGPAVLEFIARHPAYMPPAFLIISAKARAAERKDLAGKLIVQFNGERDINAYKINYDTEDAVFISAEEAICWPYGLTSNLLDKMDHVVRNGSTWFMKNEVAEVALVFHGSTLAEETRAEIIAARDHGINAAVNHLRRLEKEAQRLADLNALYEQNGIPACPEEKNPFRARGRALSEDHIWPDRRSPSIKEITQERALEAAKEMKWYSEQIPGVSSAAIEKYKASDYNSPSSYMAGVDNGVAGRGQDALMIVLAKGLGECEEMENRPVELTEAMKRYRQLLELGVRLPERPFSQLADGQYCVSALYAADKSIYIRYRYCYHVPSYEEAKSAIEEAQFCVKQAGGEYIESRHVLNSSARNSKDICPAHVTAAKAYVEQHGAEAVLAMEPKPPALVIKTAHEHIAEAYVAQVGILAAYSETRSVLNVNTAAGSSASADVPLALRSQHGQHRIQELLDLHVKEERVRATRAIKDALGVLHPHLPVSEHGLGPAIIYVALYRDDIAPLEHLFNAAKCFDRFWRYSMHINHYRVCIHILYCPHSGCLAELYSAGNLQQHYSQTHSGVEVPEHPLITSNDFAPAKTGFPAMPEIKPFTEYLEQISAAKGGTEDAVAAVKEKWEEWKKKVAEKEAGAGPSGV